MHNPEIVSLGSSRVMQFRDSHFSGSFVNAGGAMNSIAEGRDFLEYIVDNDNLKLLIIGVDFWWFNDKFIDPFKVNYKNDFDVGVRDYIKLIEYFVDGKVTFQMLYDSSLIMVIVILGWQRF